MRLRQLKCVPLSPLGTLSMIDAAPRDLVDAVPLKTIAVRADAVVQRDIVIHGYIAA